MYVVVVFYWRPRVCLVVRQCACCVLRVWPNPTGGVARRFSTFFCFVFCGRTVALSHYVAADPSGFCMCVCVCSREGPVFGSASFGMRVTC